MGKIVLEREKESNNKEGRERAASLISTEIVHNYLLTQQNTQICAETQNT